MSEVMSDTLWMVIVGFSIAFILSFAIGANDVANSFATSVGSKVLTLRGACILATIFETSGAILLGSKVSSTIREGIFNVSMYSGQEDILMLGEISALGGSFIWLFVATVFKLPVSTTHSIVGAMVGFHLVVFGTKGLNYQTLIFIVLSWFISPLLSGIISSLIFIIVKYAIIEKNNAVTPGLLSLPIFYAVTIIINLFSIFHNGPEMLGFHKIPLWGIFVISFGAGILTGIFVQIFIVPWMRRKISDECEMSGEENHILTESIKLKCNKYGNTQDNNYKSIPYENLKTEESVVEKERSNVNNSVKETALEVVKEITTDKNDENSQLDTGHTSEVIKIDNGSSKNIENKDTVQSPIEKDRGEKADRCEVAILFRFLQIMTACFGGFAHGGNDVSNAIGPLVALWVIYTEGSVSQATATPLWMLLYGGVGISIGLWVWGWRVIQTVGEDLAIVTPSSGFTIELGSASTVLFASNLGIPISTTHCKIGSVVSVGWVRERRSIDWRLFMNIVIAWVVTLPAAGGASAVLMALLLYTV